MSYFCFIFYRGFRGFLIVIVLFLIFSLLSLVTRESRNFSARKNLPDFLIRLSENINWRPLLYVLFVYWNKIDFQFAPVKLRTCINTSMAMHWRSFGIKLLSLLRRLHYLYTCIYTTDGVFARKHFKSSLDFNRTPVMCNILRVYSRVLRRACQNNMFTLFYMINDYACRFRIHVHSTLKNSVGTHIDGFTKKIYFTTWKRPLRGIHQSYMQHVRVQTTSEHKRTPYL